MSASSRYCTNHILNIVIPEDDEFEEPTPLSPEMTFYFPRRVALLRMKEAMFQENEIEVARKRIAERQSAFQRRIQFESAMIKRAIGISALGKTVLK